MRLTKQRELLLSPGEWATVGAVHEAASLEFEALSKAVADVLSGRARSLHVALRGAAEATGAEQISRAAHNWAVHEVQAVGPARAELIASDPIAVLQGVLFELAALHHEAHQWCTREAESRKLGGRPKGAAGPKVSVPSRPSERPGTKPELGMTIEELRAWEANRVAEGAPTDQIEALRHFVRRRLADAGLHQLDERVERLAKNWRDRIRTDRNRRKSPATRR